MNQKALDRFDWLRYAIHDLEVTPRKLSDKEHQILKEYRKELETLKQELKPA